MLLLRQCNVHIEKGLEMYLMGSCECISMGRGVPPGPPRVRASINPRTTAHLRAVPNSSRVYLTRQTQNNCNIQHPSLVWKDNVFAQSLCQRSVVNTHQQSRQLLQKERVWGCFDDLAVRAPQQTKQKIVLNQDSRNPGLLCQPQHPQQAHGLEHFLGTETGALLRVRFKGPRKYILGLDVKLSFVFICLIWNKLQ